MAIAPSVIQEAMVEIVDGIPGAIYAGIVGDVNHSFGYHLAPEDLPTSDYSRQLARDRNGIESNAASALDITNRTPELWATTARLRAAAKAGDPLLFGLREFAGTLDGQTTYAYDLSTGRESFGVWDSTHLFHNHLSGYRDCTRNRAAWLGIAQVMIGSKIDGAPLNEEDDMTPEQMLEIKGHMTNEANRVRDEILIATEDGRPARMYYVIPDAPAGGSSVAMVWPGGGVDIASAGDIAYFMGKGITARPRPVSNLGELASIKKQWVEMGPGGADTQAILDAIESNPATGSGGSTPEQLVAAIRDALVKGSK